MAEFRAELFAKQAVEEDRRFKERQQGGEGGEEPEGEDEVPEDAVGAVEAAELGAEELEAFEWMVPVFADLAAEGELAGVGDDPVAGFSFSDVNAVGDFETGFGDLIAADPEDTGGDAEEEADGRENVEH